MRIEIKPLSVNEAWKGRRYKTDKYKIYQSNVMSLLPKLKFPFHAVAYEVEITFGFSSRGSDIDNPVKLFLDILQKKYKINDNQIYRLIINKDIIEKGKEYIDFKIHLHDY